MHGELQVSLEPGGIAGASLPVEQASPGLSCHQGDGNCGDAYVIFAPQDVGTTSAAANVTIANTGAAPLVISNIATASGGPDFTVGTNCVTTRCRRRQLHSPGCLQPDAGSQPHG